MIQSGIWKKNQSKKFIKKIKNLSNKKKDTPLRPGLLYKYKRN